MHINRLVERFLREQDMPPTVFGRLSVRDPRLVLDMRNGRDVRPVTVEKLLKFMTRYRENIRAKRGN